MALPINIDDLINRRVVESARVEYKKNWNAEPIVHSICAFANDIDNWGGGYLIVGVEEEDGMPKFPVEGIRKLSNTIRANALEEKELFLLANNVPFDDRANLKANLEDRRTHYCRDHTRANGDHQLTWTRPDHFRRRPCQPPNDFQTIPKPSDRRFSERTASGRRQKHRDPYDLTRHEGKWFSTSYI